MFQHPIVRVGAVLVAFRLAGLFHRYVLQPDTSLGVRLALFLPAALVHTSVLVAILACGLLIAALWPAARRAIAALMSAVCALLIVFGQADLTVSSITGAPLTPTVFRTFRGIHVVTSNEFLEPLRASWLIVSIGTAAFLAFVIFAVRVIFERVERVQPAPGLRAAGSLLAVSVVTAFAVTFVPWPIPPLPIEVAFAREYLGLDGARLCEPEPIAIAQLRALVGLPPQAKWIGDDYPLVYAPPLGGRTVNPPDVVVVMVESLRAEALGFVTGSPESATPHLDDLAARSVVFESYLSNAFPSAPSVVAFHASAWPHRRKEIITDFSDTQFDGLPERLGSVGYETMYVGADPHFDNQDRWLSRWYGGVHDLVAGGTEATDRNIVARAIDEIRRHDQQPDPKPLFAFISTYSTHYPFRLPADAAGAEPPDSAGLIARYRAVLRYSDAQIGSLLTLLAERPRRHRTVTIVVGDHAFYTNLRHTSGLPENDTQWTAAIINGPPDLVGAPRRVAELASHVDMLPTVLALVGDDRPSAAVGSNLFGERRRTLPWTLSVRPGGLRFDRGGYAAFVDARVPNAQQVRRSFGSGPPDSNQDLPTAAQLTAWVEDWSYLIEHDRVWNPAFLTDRRWAAKR